jgi:hypothetical protein
MHREFESGRHSSLSSSIELPLAMKRHRAVTQNYKLGNRRGDNAEMAIIEFVNNN